MTAHREDRDGHGRATYGAPAGMQWPRQLILLAALAGSVHCGGGHQYYATPVSPAPMGPEEEASLRSGLMGTWRNWSTIHTDGVEEEEKKFRVFMVFREDGTGEQGLGDKRSPFTYRLEGRNIFTSDESYPALRVEAVSQEELRMFWYALSVTLVYKRPEHFTGLRR
jgi:hypothetical protein